MAGIILTIDEIRTAPPEVRRWLEHEISTALGSDARQTTYDGDGADHLIACRADEALAVFELIRNMLPVANLFFELGRDGQPTGQSGIVAHALADMMRHSRLENLEQLAGCLRVIDDAVRRVRGDAHATCYLLDRRGYCLVASMTSQSIRQVWREMTAMPPAQGREKDDGQRPGRGIGEVGRPDDTSAQSPPFGKELAATGPSATAESL